MKIAVMCGGSGEEQHVSRASAAHVVGELRTKGHDVTVFDLTHGALTLEQEARLLSTIVRPKSSDLDGNDNIDTLLEPQVLLDLAEADVVFLALHGGLGENGTVQAVLDTAGICYSGSGPLGSALAMNKDVSKTLLRANGIRTPDWILTGSDGRRGLDGRLGFPIIVKPCAQGSTVGLSLANRESEVERSAALAAQFGEVMFEQFIRGREITVGVLGDEALAVGEVLIDDCSLFTYDEKYEAGAVREVFPAHLSEKIAAEAKRMAVKAHRILKLEGYSRADFRLDEADRLWMIEVNSLPGLTTTSLMPQSAAAAGMDVGSLCEWICFDAQSRFSRR